MTNTFVSELEDNDLGNGIRILTKPLKYYDPWGGLIVVPTGFSTDYASVPALARVALAPLILCRLLRLAVFHPVWLAVILAVELLACFVIAVAEWLEDASTNKIAVIHDWIFHTRCRSFWVANYILFVGMVAKNAPRNALLKRLLFWVNVTLFGMIPWIQDAKRRKKIQKLATSGVA